MASSLTPSKNLAIRWTIGDVSRRGFEALRLSIHGAMQSFGPGATYVVCVNTISVADARDRTGPVPPGITWLDNMSQLPRFLAQRLDARMAEGVGWKFAPLRLFPDRHEISLDNDCILWEIPASMADWLSRPTTAQQCLIAQDVRPCFGRFADVCPPEPRNSGIRGLPPGFDLAAALHDVLDAKDHAAGSRVPLDSELDEQGLQTAALSRICLPAVVTLDEVSVCSPFHPHRPDLGRCGAHFVGLNARHIPWDYYDRPADAWMTQHWQRHRPALYRRTRTAPAPATAAAATDPILTNLTAEAL